MQFSEGKSCQANRAHAVSTEEHLVNSDVMPTDRNGDWSIDFVISALANGSRITCLIVAEDFARGA